MKTNCFVLIVINALVYIIFFLIYQKKKHAFDIGSILLITWIIGSSGSVYYYTFKVSYLSYDNITLMPLLYLFALNCLLFTPFLKFNYGNLKKINIYNLRSTFNFISIFFGIIGIPAFINIIMRLSSFSFIGAALAEMYSSEEDSANLLFLPYIKPFFSIIRHFTVFIIFLFFYQLSKQKINVIIIIGLLIDILTFLFFTLLSGSRGGIISLLLTCSFFFIFMKNIIRPTIVKSITRLSIILFSMLAIGVASISISRLTDMEGRKGKELLMDEWISQYAGEGIIRYDNTIWHIKNHLNGRQNLPYIYSFSENSIKSLEKFASQAENHINEPVIVFYTYVGDLIIDFGIIGSIVIAIILFFIIKYLFKTKNSSISFYRLIILSYFFVYLSIGITANIYRTYYTQLPIIETIVLLIIIYCFQKLNEKREAISSNSNTSL